MSKREMSAQSQAPIAQDRGQPACAARPSSPRKGASGGARKRILFCTIGQTPQVVSEAVWALKRRRWVPDEIHVVTTTFALPRIRQALQHPAGRLAVLFDGRLPPVTIHVPCRGGPAAMFAPLRDPGDGENVARNGSASIDRALADVNSETDAAIMGDLILQLLAGFMRNDDTEVHVSLAGGRKTMSAHALLAMSLVARPRDRASHVLVAPTDFEDHPEFWHPDQGGTIAPKRKPGGAGDSLAAERLDPAKATVTLVPTPTPLMRYEVKDGEALERLRLIDIVNQLNLATTLEENAHVRLDTACNGVVAGDVPLHLSAKLFALYRLIATARKEDWQGVGPDGAGPGHSGWLSAPHICFGKTRAGRDIDQLFLWFLTDAVRVSPVDNDTQDNKSINKWKAVLAAKGPVRKRLLAQQQLRPNLTNLRLELRRRFGASAARILLPANREDGVLARMPGMPDDWEVTPRFGLTLPPDAIEIV
jgi:CRISPR-associated protein (TIGR02584 family)